MRLADAHCQVKILLKKPALGAGPARLPVCFPLTSDGAGGRFWALWLGAIPA